MPWTPDSQQLGSLETDIKLKWPKPALTDKQVKDCIAALKLAKSKKQADAVLGVVDDVEQLKKLNKAWYEKLADNAPATIKAALNPEGVRTTGLSDEKINEYLNVVAKNPNFSRHRKGEKITLPVKKDGDTIAVFYNNAQENSQNSLRKESMLNGTRSSDQIGLKTKGSSRKRVTGPCYGTPRVAPMTKIKSGGIGNRMLSRGNASR